MGIITIAIDDGYKDTYDHCAGFLAENGIPATFAVPSDHLGSTLENRPVLSTDDLLHLRDSGHEIAAHTRSHRNLLDVLNLEGEKKAREEMLRAKEALEKILGETVESMVFPFIENNNNQLLRSIASEYFRSSRITSATPVFNPLPVGDPFSITGTAITTAHTPEECNRLVDTVIREDTWLIEVFHLISEKNTKSAHRDEAYRYFTSIEDFREHIRYIRSKGISVMTQREVIEKYGQPG